MTLKQLSEVSETALITLRSRIVMEVIAEKYTTGFRKKMVERKMRKGAGSTAGDYYQFGIKEAAELQS